MRQKAKEWLRRYLPAEIISVAATLLSSLIAFQLTHDRITAALAGTWCGNIGYFGSILMLDIIRARNALKLSGRHYTVTTFYKNVKALAVEFGVAELLDSFLIRPLLMYYLPLWMDSIFWGSLMAKFAADITFYIPAIIGYEYSKKKMRNFLL